MTRPITFFGGKGGVGKTTLAAATALAAAETGTRTLLVSTDPAHSLADAFGQRVGGEPRELRPGLSAVEIDAEAVAAAHVDDVEQRMSASLDAELLPAVRRHLALARSAPGTLGSAMFDAVARLLDLCPARFERIVVDTAPTGHTLRLLAMPALLTAWVEGLARQRDRVADLDRMQRNMVGEAHPAHDPVMTALQDRRARFEEATRRLREDADFWLVLIPERLPIEETVRAERALEEHGLQVRGLVLNRRLPDSADGAFLQERRAQQQVHERDITRRFPDRLVVTVDQRSRDVADVEDLRAIARGLPVELTGSGQPA